jgi:hypothetical protein
MINMEYEIEIHEMLETESVWANDTRPDVSSVFMTSARSALAASYPTGMPPDKELRELNAWCELYRFELFELAKIQKETETKQWRIRLIELASTPAGRWVDLSVRLSSFIRLFGLPPRAQYMPFVSSENSPPISLFSGPTQWLFQGPPAEELLTARKQTPRNPA